MGNKNNGDSGIQIVDTNTNTPKKISLDLNTSRDKNSTNKTLSSSAGISQSKEMTNRKRQEEQWKRVLGRRVDQLSSLSDTELFSIASTISESMKAANTDDANANPATKLPPTSSQKREDHISYVEDLLEFHFQRSVDKTLGISTESQRKHLGTVRSVFGIIDVKRHERIKRLIADSKAGSGGEDLQLSVQERLGRGPKPTAAEAAAPAVLPLGREASLTAAPPPPSPPKIVNKNTLVQVQVQDPLTGPSNTAPNPPITTATPKVAPAPTHTTIPTMSTSTSTPTLKPKPKPPTSTPQVTIDCLSSSDDEYPPPPKPEPFKFLRVPMEDCGFPQIAALTSRPACALRYRPAFDTTHFLTNTNTNTKRRHTPTKAKRAFDARLQRWDPFWKVVHDLTPDLLCTTSAVTDTNPKNMDAKGFIEIAFQLPPSTHPALQNLNFATPALRTHTEGTRRVMVRCLPVQPPPKGYYKADTHLWPKGSAVMVLDGWLNTPTSNKNLRYLQLEQRRQQSHDYNLWKGMCAALDLTPHLQNPPSTPANCPIYKFNLVSRESTEYAFQIAIVEYQSPNVLCRQLTSSLALPTPVRGALVSQCLGYNDSVEIAKKYVRNQTVCLDDDDDDGGAAVGCVPLSFQLTCPISMTPMANPVRGKDCKHVQCFDLLTFLHGNANPSGGRWRCTCCDDFVAMDDLVVCALFQAMVKKYGKEAGEGNDKVLFYEDGTWKLSLPAKRGKGGDEIRGAKRRKQEDEVICL